MSARVKIISGTYRKHPVCNMVFDIASDLLPKEKSTSITVDCSHLLGPDAPFPWNKVGANGKAKIKVANSEDYEIVSSDVPVGSADPAAPKTPVETDEEAIARIRERFKILEDMTEAAMEGTVRGMIVSGPPGVGKSYGVEETLERHHTFQKLAGKAPKYMVIKGAMTALGLYALLYNWSDPGRVLVLDDCDTILWDELALNILKGALDSGKHRRIHWNADSSKLRNEGIPDQFDFQGSIIFISNLKFDAITQGNRLGKIRDHLEAIISRCHYLDLTLDTMRDRMMRIKQLVGDGMLNEHTLADGDEEMLINYVDENKDRLREVSLRMVLKIADLYKMAPQDDKWKRLVETTCMKRELIAA